jgi:hypothetical protein
MCFPAPQSSRSRGEELALRYGTPLVIYARDAASIANFPPAAPRTPAIDEVRAFLIERCRRGEHV